MSNVTLVQYKPGTRTGASSASTTPASATTTGHIVLVGVMWVDYTAAETPTLSTMGDGTNTYRILSGSFAHVDSPTVTNPLGRIACQFAYCVGVTGTASAITAALSGGTVDAMCVDVWELTPGQFDQAAVGAGNSGTPSAGSITPSANGAFAAAIGILDTNNAIMAAGSGWTLGLNAGAGDDAEVSEYQAQTTAAALTGNFTNSGSAGQWAASMITFIPSGVPTPNPQIASGFFAA